MTIRFSANPMATRERKLFFVGFGFWRKRRVDHRDPQLMQFLDRKLFPRNDNRTTPTIDVQRVHHGKGEPSDRREVPLRVPAAASRVRHVLRRRNRKQY